MTDARRIEAAMGRFRTFFAELRTAFFEREDVLHQLALALLCREHALLTGPPGTAKSALASAVLGRILCEDTGEPSLYARQITESTVQTDLIGPIDFKNLMATGRTTHFTDEGMLGSVHAFLDEVFDGRDMLLRSALNVLQERELKQGGAITRGRIECAVMTSNRYIADVVEHARETLLAFVDRIAFISFVPRSFAEPSNMGRVLSRHVRQASTAHLDALLTIQDLDVLQELTAQVSISEPICDAMATLVEQLHSELNQAARADRDFIPTRYLSTRTVVRCGSILRAQCIYDRIFSAQERPLSVLPKDLPALRLHLLLGGPQPEEVDALAERESDPHERRQLSIVRTEREIFERCLSKLPKIEVPQSELPLRSQRAGAAAVAAEGASEPAQQAAEASPLDALAVKIEGGGFAALVAAVRELAPLCSSAEPHAEPARQLLADAVAKLNELAVRARLSAAAEQQTELLSAITQLVRLSAAADDDSVSMHPVASWLRSQSEHMIRVAVHYAGGASSAALSSVLAGSGDTARLIDERLAAVEELARLRDSVRSASAPAQAGDKAWDDAIGAVEEDLAVLWDALFCSTIKQLLAADADVGLSEVLAAAAPQLSLLEQSSERLAALRASPSGFKRKAVGARLSDLIEARMRAMTEIDRATLYEEVDRVYSQLMRVELHNAIEPRKWLLWCAQAIIRAAPEASAPDEPSYDAYRALREDEQRAPVAYTLCEVALRVAPELSRTGSQTAADMSRVSTLLAGLPDSLQSQLVELEIDRISRSLGLLERWWEQLCEGGMSVQERLDSIVRSRLFDVLWDELALARYALEARLIADVLPTAKESSAALCERIDKLDQATRRGAQALLRERTDAAWAAALSQPIDGVET